MDEMPLKCTIGDEILGTGYGVASDWLLWLKRVFTYGLYRRLEARKYM